MEPTRQSEPNFDAVCEAVRERLPLNERIRRSLPGEGRLRLDRQLPFLCVYRHPPDREDPGTAALVTTEAAYLVAPGGEEHRAGLSKLCRTIADTLQEHFGVLLLLEIWAEEDEPAQSYDHVRRPAFELVAPQTEMPSTVEAFQQALAHIRIDGNRASVRVVTRRQAAPAGMPPLTSAWLAPDCQPRAQPAAREPGVDPIAGQPHPRSANEPPSGDSSNQKNYPPHFDDISMLDDINIAYHQGAYRPPRVDHPPSDPQLAGRSTGEESQAGQGGQPQADMAEQRYRAGCYYLGLAVRPIYRDLRTGTVYPVILQQLRRQLSLALRRAIFAFTGVQEANPKLHFESLGPSAMTKMSRLVDLELSQISESFDLILQATPVNTEAAWQTFQENGFREVPRLRYRPLPYHPVLLKRRLYTVPLEEMEDPTLAYLFAQKQIELDRQISALRDLDTRQFMLLSMQIYGRPTQALIELARQIVRLEDDKTDTSGEEEDLVQPGSVSTDQLVDRIREEFDYYHGLRASFNPRIEVCGDIASGLMVAGDRLFVSNTFHPSVHRVEPLLHHEVGTHLVTYFNGREQVLRQLYAGLAGYESLQEGLAMLAEYCSGGLTIRRLRTVAGRTLAISAMIDGASFVEVFHLLRDDYGFNARSAFLCTLRAFRGGGLTKDIIYLRGLHEVLEYLARGHELEPLFVGKIALEHVPFMQELRRRGIVQAPALLPRYWEDEHFRVRLETCRTCSVLDLVGPQARKEKKASWCGAATIDEMPSLPRSR